MSQRYVLVIVVLLLMYGMTAYLDLHPRVSTLYRDYYLTRISDLSIVERKQLQPVNLGSALSYRSPQLILHGWYVSSDRFRWSAGFSPSIVFLLPSAEAKKASGMLYLNLKIHGRQRIGVLLNRKQIYSGTLVDSANLLIHFDRAVLLPGENHIKFDLPDARPLMNGDDRMVAVGIKTLVLE